MRALICGVSNDPAKALTMPGWQARCRLEDIVAMMVDAGRDQGLQ